MKSVGIVRRLDDLGRISVPKELRRTYGINDKDALEIFTDGDNIILKKYNPGCFMCSGLKDVHTIDGIKICKECAEKISKAVK